MYAFSPSERNFSREALTVNFRADGRTLNQRRSVDIRRNILDNLSGSSFVSVDFGRTEIYTGVKLRVVESQQGALPAPCVLLELSCMRRLTTELSDNLAYLQQLLQEHFINKESGLKQLVIANSKRHYLELHIQAFLLSEPHPSLLEALLDSVRQALISTALPRLHCLLNEVTNQETVEVGSESQLLQVETIEGMIVVGCLQGKYILDLTPLEFEAVDAAYLVVIGRGKVVSVESLKGAISSEEVHKICRFALSNSK